MVADIERFMHDKMAATAVEYALIAGGLFAAVMVVAIRLAIRQHIKVLDARHGLASKLAALGSEWRHWPFMDRQEFRAMVCAAGGTYPLSKFLTSRILEGGLVAAGTIFVLVITIIAHTADKFVLRRRIRHLGAAAIVLSTASRRGQNCTLGLMMRTE